VGRKGRPFPGGLYVKIEAYGACIKPTVDTEEKPPGTAVHRSVVEPPGELPAASGYNLAVFKKLFVLLIVHINSGRAEKLEIVDQRKEEETIILNIKILPLFYAVFPDPLGQGQGVGVLYIKQIYLVKGPGPGSLKGGAVFDR
jgi:hypothetical protein